jgi:prevent-host-death family protein
MNASSWSVRKARARFAEFIRKALSTGLQTITKHGRPVAVIVSAEGWEWTHTRTDNIATFFATSPLRSSDLTVKRSKDGPRKVM